MKKFLLKTILLLFALVLGTGVSWAETVTYTISSKNTLSTTGTAPAGSSATIVETYSTSKQMTSGNSQTLTLSGYEGYKITGITLSMKSNASKGAGSLSVTAGETEIAGISNAAFNTASWYGAWSTSYVDINVSLDNDPYEIQADEKVVFVIAATQNSLYCQSYTLIYEEATGGGGSELEASDLALTDAPKALNFDLYNNASDQVINYTTSSTGAVTIANSEYANFAIDQEKKTITVTPTAVTPSTQTITVNQAADETYNAGSTTFTLTITDSTPIPTHTVTFSVNGETSTGEVEEGAAIEFPDDPADVNGKTFVGWVAVAIDGTTDDAPEFVSSANMGKSDITYYAVFALASGGGSSNVTKSYGFETESDSDWTIDGPVRTSSDANTGSYAGRINTNNTYVTFNNKVKVKEFSFAFMRTSNNSNYNVYIETSEDNSNWTAEATYAMGTFNNGTYLTKTLEFDGTQELYVRFHCYNTTAVRYVDDVTITYVSGGVSYSGYCTTVADAVAVTSVSVDATASVNVGKTTTLTATVSPDNATNKNVTWASSNESIATVDENGVVTGVSAGEATITVTSVADDTKTATCTVTVSVVPGTLARPYTVAEAKAAIDNEGNVTDVYVEGIISQIDNYDPSYHSLTYWISADGTTESQQFEVYSGKGFGGANFSSINDLEIGDRVVVKGNIKKYNDIYEFNYNNQLVSRVEKPASDLAKTSNIALDVKNNALTANIADHISSSSAGAYTYESADETVATVSAEGVVTGLKVGTTTITVNQAATLSYKAGSVVINVTVQDTRVAATTIPAINISSLPSDDEGGTIVVVNPVKADEGVTFSFESSDENVLDIEGDEYYVIGIGTATVTVTATASNSALYKNVTETFEVTVNAAEKSENVIELAFDSYSTVWGTNLEGIVGGSQGFDGTITATSSNPKVLKVAVDAEGNVTVTPVAVGSATVTFSAAETASFLAADDVQQVFTITAPAGITTAPASGEVTYTFDFTDNTDWAFPTDYLTGENTYTKDGKTITLNTPDNSNGYKFNTNVILIGKSGATLTLPAFDKPVTKITTTGVSGASGKVKQNIYVGETAVSTETTSAKDDHEYIINPEYQAPGTIYTFKVTNANNTQLSDLTVHMNQDPSETVTLNKYGYATYCSVNPMDFSSTEGYTAWRVNSIASDGTITFKKITEAIKGGQGVLLYNIDADGENTSSVNVKFASSDYELVGNLLVGTTAPTYVEETSVYGLSGDSFKKNSAAGTIGANKAYLDADDIPNEVQAFTFVFEDDETGITETRTVTREEVESIFNLAGQRLNRTQKGINIVNGKKVFIKK